MSIPEDHITRDSKKIEFSPFLGEKNLELPLRSVFISILQFCNRYIGEDMIKIVDEHQQFILALVDVEKKISDLLVPFMPNVNIVFYDSPKDIISQKASIEDTLLSVYVFSDFSTIDVENGKTLNKKIVEDLNGNLSIVKEFKRIAKEISIPFNLPIPKESADKKYKFRKGVFFWKMWGKPMERYTRFVPKLDNYEVDVIGMKEYERICAHHNAVVRPGKYDHPYDIHSTTIDENSLTLDYDSITEYDILTQYCGEHGLKPITLSRFISIKLEENPSDYKSISEPSII